MTRSGGAGRAKPPAARAKPPKAKAKTNEGRWTDEEHRKFLEAYDAMVAVDPARRRWPNVAAAVGTRSTTQCRSHAQKYFKKIRRAQKKRRAAPAAPVVVTDSDSSLDVSSTSRSPRPAASPQADYAAVPTPPVQPRAGSFDDSLSPTSALLREPIVDDRALTVDDAPHLTGPVSSWASLSLLDPGFTA